VSNQIQLLYMKFIVGLVLFGVWVYLDVAHVALSGDLIDFIKYVLVGLAVHLIGKSPTDPVPTQVLPPPPSN
jgi:hypothetical protein